MRTLLLAAVFVAGACGPGSRNPGDPDAPGGRDGNGGDSSNADMSRVYAHSGSKLYRIDTQSLHPVEVGTITGLGAMSLTDLAIDKSDHMVGVTLNSLYAINPATGAATLVKALVGSSGYTSLSYVPSNLNDPSSTDILVSANDQGDVFQIEPTTGVSTKLGSFGTAGAGKVISSGDLIGVRGLGIYATVDVGTQPNDYLASIDPVTWKATPIGTGTGFNHIFGLGFWAGTIYGFVDNGTGSGKIITINPNTGVGTAVDTGAIQWFGAGVSTDAPILQ